jgi:Tfp pilus assembly protein PilO
MTSKPHKLNLETLQQLLDGKSRILKVLMGMWWHYQARFDDLALDEGEGAEQREQQARLEFIARLEKLEAQIDEVSEDWQELYEEVHKAELG